MHLQLSAPADPRQRTLFFLANPDLLECWHFLPVVRRKPSCEKELGVVYHAMHVRNLAGYACTVFLCNFLLLPDPVKELLAVQHETFDTFKEFADANSSVD